MTPFLSEEEYNFDNEIDGCVVENEEQTPSKYSRLLESGFLKDDGKFFVLGGVAAFFVFCIITYVMYFNSKPVDVEDLPTIQADMTPYKIKPEINNQVNHQDKIVYDNISGDRRAVKREHIVPSPEEIMTLPEPENEHIEAEDTLPSNIEQINANEPKNKKILINEIISEEKSPKSNVSAVNDLVVVENAELAEPPIKKIEIPTTRSEKKQEIQEHPHQTIKDFINGSRDELKNKLKKKIQEENSVKKENKTEDKLENKNANTVKQDSAAQILPAKGNIMIQMAIVRTKAAAEAEYKRIANKNKFLKRVGKKIAKVDLGKKKGIRYKIQAGPYKTVSEAKKAVKLMKENGFTAYIAKKI